MPIRNDKGGRVTLPTPEGRTSLVERDGLLVHRGKAPHGFDWSLLVEDCREETAFLRSLLGTET
jgi:hypothetical protein